MNSLQLKEALDTVMKARTLGVFPSDRIPRIWSRPAAIIANLDDHTRSGSHWVGFYVTKDGVGSYFDSLGFPPLNSTFSNRLTINSKRYDWNRKKIQSDSSTVCGQYCLVFLYYLNKGFSLNEFCQMFTDNYKKNDILINKLYRKHILSKVKRNKNKRRFKSYYGGGRAERLRYVQCCVPAMYHR